MLMFGCYVGGGAETKQDSNDWVGDQKYSLAVESDRIFIAPFAAVVDVHII